MWIICMSLWLKSKMTVGEGEGAVPPMACGEPTGVEGEGEKVLLLLWSDG